MCCGLPFGKDFSLVILGSTVMWVFAVLSRSDPLTPTSVVAILQIFPPGTHFRALGEL